MQNSPLIDLPRTIRDEIYKYYLDELELRVYSHWIAEGEPLTERTRFFNRVDPGQLFNQFKPRFPHIIYACRQLHDEVSGLVCSHVPLVMVDTIILIKDCLKQVPGSYLQRVHKLVLGSDLVKGDDLKPFILPYFPELKILAWHHDPSCGTEKFLEKPQHSVNWRQDGPVKLLDALDQQNEYAVVRMVLQAQLHAMLTPYCQTIKTALQRGIRVEVEHSAGLYYPVDSNATSWGDSYFEPVFAGCVFPF